MVVATASERLSCSSDYTGHSLGGIDRAVRIYALPKLHISSLHLNAGLDEAYRDGELQIDLGIDNPDQDDPERSLRHPSNSSTPTENRLDTRSPMSPLARSNRDRTR